MFLFREWILNPYRCGLLDSSSKVLCLPFHYAELSILVTSDVRMVINWRRGFEVLFKSLSKCSCKLTNIFLATLYPVNTCTYISCHFSIWWFLCPWGPPGHYWRYCLLWSIPVYHATPLRALQSPFGVYEAYRGIVKPPLYRGFIKFPLYV